MPCRQLLVHNQQVSVSNRAKARVHGRSSAGIALPVEAACRRQLLSTGAWVPSP